MPGNVKSLVWQVSPWWKEEQHRRGHVCPLAVEEVPRQNHRHCTCDKINADDVFTEKGDGEKNLIQSDRMEEEDFCTMMMVMRKADTS